MNFGDFPAEYCKKENAQIVILPVPYDRTSTWIKGADRGPEAIIKASANLEFYDIETDYQVYKKGVYTSAPVEEDSTPEKMVEAVEEEIHKLLGENKFVVTVGGNHSVSIGAFNAFSRNVENLTIIQFDAHSDLRQSYEGSPLNHACVMARAKEVSPVIQIGIRSMCAEEKFYIEENRIFYAHDMPPFQTLTKQLSKILTDNVYITIDLDVFDPSLMPTTGTPEPGGLQYLQIMEILRFINERSNITGFDVVELCPSEHNKTPDFVAAKLIYQLLSMKFKKQQKDNLK